MSNDTRPTLLEQLPVEIFLQVFASFSLSQIVKTFSGLNSYIDSCIRAVNSASHALAYNDSTAADLLHSFPTQIGRLILTHSPAVDFTPLINLRSLTLKYGTLAQFDGIRPQHFPQLEILHLCGINSKSIAEKKKSLDDLFEVILSNGFPRLRMCSVVGFESLTPNSAWTGSPTLRVLILDLRTPIDDEQIRSLCPNLRPYESASSFSLDTQAAGTNAFSKRLISEILRLERWQSEKKFILESSLAYNTEAGRRSGMVGPSIIRGRILPQKDPYCFTSFLVEIRIGIEFPFKVPDARILDRIYHPKVDEGGNHCCCWGFNWRPTSRLTDFIEGIISVIDNVNLEDHGDKIRTVEYEHNYDEFYQKALRCTLDYGRPRF